MTHGPAALDVPATAAQPHRADEPPQVGSRETRHAISSPPHGSSGPPCPHEPSHNTGMRPPRQSQPLHPRKPQSLARLAFRPPRHYALAMGHLEEAPMDVRMNLARIVIQDTSDQQIIFLREREGTREFPIVIGDPEAAAIDRRLKGYKRARPMTHDLLADVIQQLGAELEKIVINDLKNHTFYAKLVLRSNGEVIEIDSRPSDAIALGVASETPIFVSEHVLREICRS